MTENNLDRHHLNRFPLVITEQLNAMRNLTTEQSAHGVESVGWPTGTESAALLFEGLRLRPRAARETRSFV